MFQQYLANMANVISAGYKSNAYAPLVWFNGVVDPLLILAVCFTSNVKIEAILLILLCIIIAGSFIVYVVLLIIKPGLLQSESFRIEDKKLDLIAQKGSDLIEIAPVNLTPPTKIEGRGE